MAEASTLIVVGTVTSVGEGVFHSAPATEDFRGTQDLEAVVTVEVAVHGDARSGESVSIRWPGYEVGLDGNRGPQMIVNGQPPPEVGNRNLWFLADDPPGFGLVAFEGRFAIGPDGALSPVGPVDSGAARELTGSTLDDIITMFM